MNESFEIFDCGVIAVSKGIFTPDSLTAKSYACIKKHLYKRMGKTLNNVHYCYLCAKVAYAGCSTYFIAFNKYKGYKDSYYV